MRPMQNNHSKGVRVPKRAIDGVLLLDKPKGLSSSLALTRVRGMFRAEKGGHTGALDPLASGLLPICLGEAAKFSTYFLEGRKRYIATGRLGIVTTSADAEGEIVASSEVGDALSHLNEVVEQFKGKIIQTPPIYSAIKVSGRPLYKYARKGQEVEIPKREVEIYSLDVKEVISGEEPSFTVEVYCSKGTYIRTLIADIGNALGCGAYVTMLRRIEVQGLPKNEMIGLEDLQNLCDGREDLADFTQLDKLLLPVDKVMEWLPCLTLQRKEALDLCHGIRLHEDLESAQFSSDRTQYDGPWQVRCEGEFLGVARVLHGFIIPERMMSHPMGINQ